MNVRSRNGTHSVKFIRKYKSQKSPAVEVRATPQDKGKVREREREEREAEEVEEESRSLPQTEIERTNKRASEREREKSIVDILCTSRRRRDDKDEIVVGQWCVLQPRRD